MRTSAPMVSGTPVQTAGRPASTKQSLVAKNPVNDKIISYSDTSGNKIELSIGIIKNYLCGGANIDDAEAYMFLSLCQYQKLNPFTREAYCVKYGSSPAQLIVGKNAFTKRAAQHPKFQGMKAGILVVNSNGTLEQRMGEIMLDDETLVGGWAEVFVKDYVEPVYASVSFRERCQYNSNGEPMAKWKTSPALMIRKCALVAALREAFPDILGGMYSAEEMGYEEVEENAAPIIPPKEIYDVNIETGEVIGQNEESENDIEQSFFGVGEG